jgi:coenzyme F420-reducing hydrogenase delta subunit
VNVSNARQLLRLLGIGQRRLVERSFASHEKAELVDALWDFAERIEKLGPNPAKPNQEREAS